MAVLDEVRMRELTRAVVVAAGWALTWDVVLVLVSVPLHVLFWALQYYPSHDAEGHLQETEVAPFIEGWTC